MKFQLLFIIMLLAVATFNSFILIFKREKNISGYRFLYASLFFYNFCLSVYFVWFEAGFIMEAPELLRTISPLMYLCAPLFFFFIRNSLSGSVGLSKRDWLHFLPALIHLLDLLPFYFESSQVKSVFAANIVSDKAKINFEAGGLIPIQFHYLFRIFLQTGYFVYSLYLVNKVRPEIFIIKKGQRRIFDLKIVLINLGWMVIFQFVYAVFEIMIHFGNLDLIVENYYLRRISLLGLLGLNLFVNFRAEFFNDRKENKKSKVVDVDKQKIHIPYSKNGDQPEINIQISKELPDAFSQKEIELIKSEIISKMEEAQIFTETGLTLNQFAKRINVTPKLVSLVINREFDKNFNEFLNQYRIAFAILKIKEGYLDDYTLEALGEMSGFNSRTTFFNSFKKEKGCSPTEYWKKFQESPS
ncbi:helix-turn-helix domain-containing protein [Aquiflexum sp.]|uniref:helix-turn-helix domain-containing protein n=1 Tax=Aquiflexum sp. TaxID=1872584 RepID=UPI003594029F